MAAKKRYGVEVTGVCQICGETCETQMHHIISQAKIDRIKKPDLRTNSGNIVELCIECHNLTDSSTYRRWYRSREDDKQSREIDPQPCAICRGHNPVGRGLKDREKRVWCWFCLDCINKMLVKEMKKMKAVPFRDVVPEFIDQIKEDAANAPGLEDTIIEE